MHIYHLRPKWRPVSTNGLAYWHCFITLPRPENGFKYGSLCGKFHLKYSGGSFCHRPPSQMRCPICDGDEADLLGKEECLPESKNWKDRS